jgi:hypothetical protein
VFARRHSDVVVSAATAPEIRAHERPVAGPAGAGAQAPAASPGAPIPSDLTSVAPRNLGTLQVGAPADVSVLELMPGPVSFVDTRNNTRMGQAHLKPVHTVTAGVPFGRPYNSPFCVR